MTVASFSFVVTIPAGALSSSLFVQNLTLNNNPVTRIRWRVPPGPRGHMSFAIAQSGVPVIPGQAGAYITADNEYADWTFTDLPETGIWQAVGFNTGTFPHAVYLLMFTDDAAGVGDLPLGDVSAGFPTSDGELTSLWLT